MVAQPGPNRYEVKLPADCKAMNEFHVNRLKACNDPDLLKYKGTRRSSSNLGGSNSPAPNHQKKSPKKFQKYFKIGGKN
eukprot:SAG11_NODE_144_length_14830_cov_17.955943_14_plen_79_part_00